MSTTEKTSELEPEDVAIAEQTSAPPGHLILDNGEKQVEHQRWVCWLPHAYGRTREEAIANAHAQLDEHGMSSTIVAAVMPEDWAWEGDAGILANAEGESLSLADAETLRVEMTFGDTVDIPLAAVAILTGRRIGPPCKPAEPVPA